MQLTPKERFLRAARKEPVDRPPVWIMRQAGRYLPEYRELRGKLTFKELMRNPEMAARVTLMPLDAVGTEALILFNDILTPLEAMGAELDFTSSGPKFPSPIRTRADVNELTIPDPHTASPDVARTLKIVCDAAGPELPVIGFTGAPFTMASYLIEGGTSRTFHQTKLMMFQEPDLFDELLDKLATTITAYLQYQIESGADVVQLFDTWVGCLTAEEYRTRILPVVTRCIADVGKDVPIMLYCRNGEPLLELLADTGADGLGIDWTVRPEIARKRVGDRVSLQGNLDPDLLYAPREQVVQRTTALLNAFGPEPGHIFNLGHGIIRDTPVDNARAMIETVKAHSWD